MGFFLHLQSFLLGERVRPLPLVFKCSAQAPKVIAAHGANGDMAGIVAVIMAISRIVITPITSIILTLMIYQIHTMVITATIGLISALNAVYTFYFRLANAHGKKYGFGIYQNFQIHLRGKYIMNEAMPNTQMGPLGLLMMIVFAIITVLPFWFIFSKAGYSKWLSLLLIVPFVNLIMIYFLAFSKWPILKKKEQ